MVEVVIRSTINMGLEHGSSHIAETDIVPLHAVWQTPVARLVRTSPARSLGLDYYLFADNSRAAGPWIKADIGDLLWPRLAIDAPYLHTLLSPHG